MYRAIVTIVLCWCVSGWAETGETLDFSIRQNFMSARALGMGNAYIALADDYNALLMNPAGLARLDTWQLNLSLEGAVGSDVVNVINQLSSKNSEGVAALTGFLESLNGTTTHLRVVPASGFLVRPNWGFAFIPVDVTANFNFRKVVSSALDATIYADTTMAMGFARDARVGNGRFSWGVTGKLVHRVHMAKSLIALDLAQNSGNIFSDKDANEGLTVDADVGVLWTPRLPPYGAWKIFKLARPQFGAVVRNVLDTGFTQNFHTLSKDSGQPVRLYRTLDLGTKWEYPKFWIFKSRGLLDIRDIGHPNWSPYKGLHIGWELGWRVYDWWKGYYRVGINQGYLTAGISARLGIFNLDLATFGEEVGSFNDRKENRRVMFKMNIEI